MKSFKDTDDSTIGFNFCNSYAKLPERFYTRVNPTAVGEPKWVMVNHALATELGLHLGDVDDAKLADYFSGNCLPEGAQCLAQAYAGHQFGQFNYLGDGRAHLIGEHITPVSKRVDIQLKGSGSTPYGRRGDGRAALGPMLREYIISEAMFALGVPTTRSLAVVTTGEPVFRETVLQGAVLTRVADSHIRVGTFQFLAAEQDKTGLRELADYTIARHYPEVASSHQPYVDFFTAVMRRQITLITQWMRVGFIHGVMNTDNMAICGETIDYGPCAFMDKYNPDTVFSSIDRRGRYAFANQSRMACWNLARLAESLLPLLHDDSTKAVATAEDVLDSYEALFQQEWLNMMRQKLGLFGEQTGDAALVNDLLQWMHRHEADYTNTFRELATLNLPAGAIYQNSEFTNWHSAWQQRLQANGKPLQSALSLMQATNPVFIARNHRVEAALAAADDGDLSKLHELLKVLSAPYKDDSQYAAFKALPTLAETVQATFCGT